MNWDIQLNEEVDMLRETVMQFAQKHIAPIAEDVDRENEFPQHLWRELGNLGLLGISKEKIAMKIAPYSGLSFVHVCVHLKQTTD